MKKMVLLSLLLSTVLFAHAAEYTEVEYTEGEWIEEVLVEQPCRLDEVLVPDPKFPCTLPYSFAAEFIYVQPTGNQVFSDGSNLDWAPGLRIEGSYHFNQGTDVTVDFTWFDNTSKKSVEVNNQFKNEEVNDKFYSLSAEFGHTVYYGENMTTRFHAGGHYANIKRNFKNLNFDDLNESQSFEGFGPRFGMNFRYGVWGTGLELMADVAVALLIGQSSYKVENIKLSYTRSITPAVDGRLGARYLMPVQPMNGYVAIEGGYQWTGYYQTMPKQFGSVTLETDNYAFHGLFVGLKWLGDLG